jgi:hypothetical protein
MVLIKKVRQGEGYDWDAGAVMVVAKKDNFAEGYVLGEIGLIVFGYGGRIGWTIVMSGGWHTKNFKTFRQLLEVISKEDWADFFHIEIKP